MTCYIDTFATPLGYFSIAVNEHNAVVATAFGSSPQLLRRLGKCHVIRDTFRLTPAREQVKEYFNGRRRSFDLALAPVGTVFQQRVWRALRRIHFGSTTSYGALAKKLARPGAARAVGRANATNPICLIIPCHRVIGADGALTGFAFGEAIKRWLLEHEASLGARAA
ncbi:MAG: methylated-DNA--[protein]-cysteine S-methyltransferase [Opitutaceae bacterium]|nr:methylated-DNA--[protein]-cysteine S-methyltransferase [Opitutaceae bacterium]